ncbi:MAG: hypothetical protein ACE5FJ_04685 [Gemmatimonadales bacterium]
MRRLMLGAILLCGTPVPGAAQIPIPVPNLPIPTTGDTIRAPAFREQPPISPLGALWRSMLVPGWGQAILGRRVTGAVFVFWEGISLTMTLKSMHQKSYLERTGSNNVDAKQQEIEDWAVLWGFNHLMAGAEAFVASLLWDFPVELDGGVTPDGDVQLGVRYYFR